MAVSAQFENENMTNLADQLRRFVKGEVMDDAATLETYSRDASLFKVRPEVVVSPKDVSDITNLVYFVLQEKKSGRKISLTPRLAGTDMTGGPLSESIVVDMTRHFNRLGQVGDGWVVTEPGVYYRDFEKETLKKNLLLPSYPASREICTVGGMVANNAGGEKTLSYGKTEQYVEKVKMILSDGQECEFRSLSLGELAEKKRAPGLEGEIYRKMSELIEQNYDLLQKAKPRVSKNSAGYYLWNVFNKQKGTFDLSRMITGSQGTLGIITEIKFKLIRPKPHSRLLVIFLKDVKVLGELTQEILKFHPESFESYDDNTFALAVKLFPAIARQLKGNIFKLIWQFLPDFWAVLTGGVPKLVLLVEFTADCEDDALKKTEQAQKTIKDFKIKSVVTKTASESRKYWVMRRESFNLLRHHVHGKRTAPFIDDFSVRPEYLPEFLPKLNEVLSHYKITYTIAGHVGDGNFHIIPLMDLAKPEMQDIIFELSKKVYDLVLQYHGSITGEHNDGLIRGPYLEQMYGKEVYRLFEETENIFDPDNIFNPGKKVGSTLEYARAHLDVQN